MIRKAGKLLAAAVLCLNPLSCVFVVGWVQSLMRRQVLETWKGSSRAAGEEPAEKIPILRRAWRAFLRGAQSLFNTWVLTMPGCVLWLFSWYDGWNNSFHKGYEQAWVGPVTGILGAVLFVAAMLYVPVALARQAMTGAWREFYRFEVVREVLRTKWMSCAALAGLYAGCSLPVTVFKVIPNFLPRGDWAVTHMTERDAASFLLRYSLGFSWVFLPLYIGLRLAAARIYASGVLELVRAGALDEESLAPGESEALRRLELLRAQAPAQRHALLRAIGWAGTRAGRVASTAAAVVFWALFVAQVYVSQFLNYRPLAGWLNQPLVQLPWVRLYP